MKAKKLVVGSPVLYFFKNTAGAIVERAAVIVNTWGNGDAPKAKVQLQVFLDGTNDSDLEDHMGHIDQDSLARGMTYRTSVEKGDEVGNWNFHPDACLDEGDTVGEPEPSPDTNDEPELEPTKAVEPNPDSEETQVTGDAPKAAQSGSGEPKAHPVGEGNPDDNGGGSAPCPSA